MTFNPRKCREAPFLKNIQRFWTDLEDNILERWGVIIPPWVHHWFLVTNWFYEDVDLLMEEIKAV